jgi:hypothetical protein
VPLTLPKPKLSEDYVVPEPGVYVLEFIGYDNPEISPFDPDKETIKLKFRLIDEDYPGCQVNEFYGWSTHPRSKLYPVLKALNGGTDIDFEKEEFDLDEFIGKHMQGTIDTITKPRKNGNPGETVTFAKLVAASPMKRRQRREQTAPAPLPPPTTQSTWDDEEDEGVV